MEGDDAVLRVFEKGGVACRDARTSWMTSAFIVLERAMTGVRHKLISARE